MDVESAIKKLIATDPFYGYFSIHLQRMFDNLCPTLCVAFRNSEPELHINPEFWESLKDDEQIAVLKHELGHICLFHCFMNEGLEVEPMKFNIAADLEVNSGLENLPEGCLLPEKMGLQPGLGTIEYLRRLPKDIESDEGGDGNEEGSGGDGNSSEDDSSNGKGNSNGGQQSTKYGKVLDDHSHWQDIKESEKEVAKMRVSSYMERAAEQTLKDKGTIPGKFEDMIKAAKRKQPVFNWRKHFRRLLGTEYDVRTKHTRRKESKRFEDAMGMRHLKKANILIAIDTSGSVEDKDLSEFFTEVNFIYKAGVNVDVLQFDYELQCIDPFKGKFDGKVLGRGGTNFCVPVDYYLEYRRKYTSLIMLTDGYDDIPSNTPKKTIWVITPDGSRQNYPGKVIYMNNDNSSEV